MKIFTVLLSSIVILFTGCSEQPIPPKPIIVTEVVKEKVIVPIKCIIEYPEPNLVGEGFMPTIELLKFSKDLAISLIKCSEDIDRRYDEAVKQRK